MPGTGGGRGCTQAEQTRPCGAVSWGEVRTVHTQGRGACRSRGTLGRTLGRCCQAGERRQGAGCARGGDQGGPHRDIHLSRSRKEVRSPVVQSGQCIRGQAVWPKGSRRQRAREPRPDGAAPWTLARTPALTLHRKGLSVGFCVKRHGSTYVLEGHFGCRLRMSRARVDEGDRSGGHHDVLRQR